MPLASRSEGGVCSCSRASSGRSAGDSARTAGLSPGDEAGRGDIAVPGGPDDRAGPAPSTVLTRAPTAASGPAGRRSSSACGGPGEPGMIRRRAGRARAGPYRAAGRLLSPPSRRRDPSREPRGPRPSVRQPGAGPAAAPTTHRPRSASPSSSESRAPGALPHHSRALPQHSRPLPHHSRPLPQRRDRGTTPAVLQVVMLPSAAPATLGDSWTSPRWPAPCWNRYRHIARPAWRCCGRRTAPRKSRCSPRRAHQRHRLAAFQRADRAGRRGRPRRHHRRLRGRGRVPRRASAGRDRDAGVPRARPRRLVASCCLTDTARQALRPVLSGHQKRARISTVADITDGRTRSCAGAPSSGASAAPSRAAAGRRAQARRPGSRPRPSAQAWRPGSRPGERVGVRAGPFVLVQRGNRLDVLAGQLEVEDGEVLPDPGGGD